MFVRQKIVLLSLIISLHAANLLAQAPDTIWTRTYGGSGDDRANSVCETSDGGFIIAGSTNSSDQRDVYIIKTNFAGDTLWTRTYGGEDWDEAKSIQQSFDGGYIITGSTYSFGAGGGDLYLIKIDSNGDTLWTKTYGGEDWDGGISVQNTIDGGYVILGYTESFGNGYRDIWFLKTNESGDTLWTKTFGGAYSDMPGSVQQTSDEGYVIVGSTDLIPYMTFVYLIKTDADGNVIWSHLLSVVDAVFVRAVEQTPDGGYIIGVSSFSYSDSDWDIYLLKTYSNGDSAWARIYGGAEWDQVFSVELTSDGGYMIAGYTESFGAGSEDFYIIKTDSFGDEIWSAVYGGSSMDICFSARQISDEGYIMVGDTHSFGEGNGDVWLIRLDSETAIAGEGVPVQPSQFTLFQNSPNPFNPSTTINYSLPKISDIRIEIYNLLGQRVATIYEGIQDAGEHNVIWDASDYPSGVYFTRLEMAEKSESIKMVLLK
jgi:hypothetical protein